MEKFIILFKIYSRFSVSASKLCTILHESCNFFRLLSSVLKLCYDNPRFRRLTATVSEHTRRRRAQKGLP